jgi:hypothetical protein
MRSSDHQQNAGPVSACALAIEHVSTWQVGKVLIVVGAQIHSIAPFCTFYAAIISVVRMPLTLLLLFSNLTSPLKQIKVDRHLRV